VVVAVAVAIAIVAIAVVAIVTVLLPAAVIAVPPRRRGLLRKRRDRCDEHGGETQGCERSMKLHDC
jgi:hypothetical protein